MASSGSGPSGALERGTRPRARARAGLPPLRLGADPFGFPQTPRGAGARGTDSMLPDTVPRSDDRVSQVQREVDEVSGIMKENVSTLVQQGEALNELNAKSEDLLSEARNFKKSSTNMKNRMWWMDMRVKLIIGAVVGVILLIIIINIINSFKDKDDY